MWPEKVGAWTPSPQKIQSPDHVVKKKIMKTFDLKFGMTKKIWYPDPYPPWKIQSPELLVYEKISKKFLSQIWHDQKSW